MHFKPLALCAMIVTALPSRAQIQILAGSNDNPNPLINATHNDPAIHYEAEVANSGSTNGTAANLAFNQVRVSKVGTTGCSLVAQTNNGSNNVSIYLFTAAGISPVPGSPFATGVGTQSLAWAADGGALYVPLAVAGSANVVTLTISCAVGGGPVTVTNAGTVALTGFDLLRDAEVIGTGMGSHLCVTGTNSNNVGCVPILASRLPGNTAVNTMTVSNARGVRISPTNCGVVGSGDTTTVHAFSVSGASGTIVPTNTATAATLPRYGAIYSNGSLAAFGGLGSQFTLYSLDGSCQITRVASNDNGIATSLVEYMAYAGTSLWVADSLANRIRGFTPTAGGIGTPFITSTTNHATTNGPGGIEAAFRFELPVGLMDFSVD